MTAPALPIPACMTADELDLWQATTGRGGVLQPGMRAGSPCDDCTLGYAADMRAIGRCDGTPGGVEEDEMETPELVAIAPVTDGPTLTAMRAVVRVVAPCLTCTHVRVCRLQPGTDLAVTVEVPALDPALDVTFTATVECAEYARTPGTPKPAKRTYSPEALERLRAGARRASEARKAAREAVA